jgi:formiminoglutamase
VSVLQAADVAPPVTSPADPRVGHLLGRDLADGAPRPAAVLVGFPSDEGVRRNGGRPGAAGGPRAIRERLYRLAPDPADDRMTGLVRRTRDLGDVAVSGDLERDQDALAEAIAPLVADGVFTIVLGGGHETTFGHFLAYARGRRPVSILNWDAHADVRELHDGLAHSGSPFRQALEHPSGACRRYAVAGLLPWAVAAAHAAFVCQRGGEVVWRADVTEQRIDALYDDLHAPALVSFDLDAVDQRDAPGVSAPAAGGLSADLWLHAAGRAGRCTAVTSADVVELNPSFDRDGQTARLAALTVWQLLRGFAQRG